MEFDGKAYADSLRADSMAFADAARGRLGLPVPSCPGWTVERLVEHLTNAHLFWRLIGERRLQDPRELDDVDPSTPADRLEFFLEHAHGFADFLERADPQTRVWTWSRQNNIGFIQRRMAHETAVHRWDAQLAMGKTRPIDGDLAADGIDEFLEHFLEAREPITGTGELIHMHRTDGHGEWLVRLTPKGAEVSHGHEKGSAAVRGKGSDLLLAMWRRVDPESLELFGDRSMVERLLAHADLD